MIETPKSVIGFEPKSAWVLKDRVEHSRAQPGETEKTVFGLGKFVKLLIGGNPTAVQNLFAPESCKIQTSPEWEELCSMAPKLIGLNSLMAHYNYAKQQRCRLYSGRGTRASRPELVEAHGYDTKYAYQVLRLCMQGIELGTTGKITLPIQGENLDLLMKVRQGHFNFDQCIALLTKWEDDLLKIAYKPLSEQVILEYPDYKLAEEWICKTYVRIWGDAIRKVPKPTREE